MANLMMLLSIATGLLRDKLYEQDFAGTISQRAPEVLGPISRYRVADILLHMKLVSRASRPGLTVGILRILTVCNGLCKDKDFTLKIMNKRVGLVVVEDDPDLLALSLISITTNALVCTLCSCLVGSRLLCFHGETIFSSMT